MNLVKLCRVCGDQASGFNYSGLCCESCKVFFHRNANNHEYYVCMRNNDCKITKATRRRCRKCRLEKCFQNGMKLPEISAQQVQLVKLEAAKRADSFMTIENMFSSDLLVKLLHESNYGPVYSPDSSEHGPHRRHAIKLSEYENAKLSEIVNAVSVFVDEYKLPLVKKVTNIYDGLVSTEFYIKTIIQFCKRVPAFNQLPPSDQFALMKPFCFDIKMIRFAHLFDLKLNGFPVILSDDKTETLFMDLTLLKDFQPEDRIVEYINFVIKLKNEMENDSKIRDLLIAYTLFKRLESISSLEFVRYNFSMYSRLLLRYLEQKYKNLLQAKRKYATLTKLVEYFPLIKESERCVFKRMDLTKVPAVCIELYNL